MEQEPVDPTNAGYDEATARADGYDTIPTGVSPQEAEIRLVGHGAEAAGVASEQDAIDDVHNVDEMAEVTRGRIPIGDGDDNSTDNSALWSMDPG